jgi:GTP-binding protein
MRRKREFVAGNGFQGSSWRKRGKQGENLDIPVPIGTLVSLKTDSGEEILLSDLRAQGQKIMVAKGGRGGLGNARFATAANQAPEIASKGEPGEERLIILEVKLITDICIVGHPNSGKSTLLSKISRAKPEIADYPISRAKPEIADYPFTTRQPILGVIPDTRRDFIVAEIPGLVEGAHLGKGLGNEFLRHAERTRLLIYLLDGSSSTVASDLSTLDAEMDLYKDLAHKPKIVAVNKIDLPEAQAHLPALKRSFTKLRVPVFYISGASGQAVLELIRKAMEMVVQASRDEEIISQPQIAVFRPKPRK